ncbi:hypothetical protein ACHAWT_009940 [Skeletonema menzelii]
MAPQPPQTTLLIGGSNGTATLCAILGDKSNPANANHVLRVATRSGDKYLDDNKAAPRVWRCTEKKHLSDVVAADFLPTRLITHVGAPDSVFVYGGQQEEGENRNDDGAASLNPLERAISGVHAPDNGGPVDIIILACPVSAHFALLRRIAKAMYNLDRRGLLGRSPARPPIYIGSLYAAGGFDWMSRIAFLKERPVDFDGTWKRSLGLFGLKAFPYLTKSLKAGEVTLHGRFPQLQVAVCPSNAGSRSRVKMLLDRVLQNNETGKKLEFLGLSSNEMLGGDGTCEEELQVMNEKDYTTTSSAMSAASAYGGAKNAMIIAAQTHKQIKNAKEGISASAAATSTAPPIIMTANSSATATNSHSSTKNLLPPKPALDALLTQSLADQADPFSSLAFLTCTLNSTNQILHPCILVALFRDEANPERNEKDGTISWNPTKELTPLPRFYADGAAKAEAGQLITAIAGGEMYFVIDALERLLSPRGYDPIAALHGGEPVGRKVMNFLGNSPHDLGSRSGLTNLALKTEFVKLYGNESVNESTASGSDEEDVIGNRAGLINREKLLAWCMSTGLSHNSRLNAVLSPCIIDESSRQEDGTVQIKPNAQTRFFTDDTQHGLCICLGLGELLGFDLERDMPQTLYVVRRLQKWMKKEFVLPQEKVTAGSMIVGDAKDVSETSAPQAFGVKTVQELKRFLQLDVFSETHELNAEGVLRKSGLMARL